MMSHLRLVLGDWSGLGEDASRVRTEVFVREQGIPAENEWDANDASCVHCVAYDGEQPVATGRLLPDAHIGRMAVLRTHRRTGAGGRILRTLVEAARARGDTELALNAQSYVCTFYERHGFVARGEPHVEEGIAHQAMTRVLDLGSDAVARGRNVTASDGTILFERDWMPASPRPPVRGVYLLHGLGEHTGRYEPLARWFVARGWAVRGHDHVGHGRSAGRRGVTRRAGQVFEHAAQAIERFANELGSPPVLLGQSLGGALAAAIVHRKAAPASAMLLSAPAFDVGAGRAQSLLAAVMLRVAPALSLDNRIDPRLLSHDLDEVRAYVEDPLVHRRICARLYADLVAWGATALERSGELDVPALLLVPGADRLVHPRGAIRYAGSAPGARMQHYAPMLHEPFHEHAHARAAVLADVAQWLEELEQGAPRSRLAEPAQPGTS